LINVTDPSIKDPRAKLTFKSWGFYFDMPHDSLVRVIVVVMTLIAVVLAVLRVSWSLTAIIGTLTIVRVVKVIVTIVVVMLAIPTRSWSLRIPMVVIKMFTLTRLSYLQSFYGLHPSRNIVI